MIAMVFTGWLNRLEKRLNIVYWDGI